MLMFQQQLRKWINGTSMRKGSSHPSVSWAPPLLKRMLTYIFPLFIYSPGCRTLSLFFFFYFVIVVYNYKYLELKYMNAFYRKLLETTFLLVLEYLLKYGLVPFHLNRQNS